MHSIAKLFLWHLSVLLCIVLHFVEHFSPVKVVSSQSVLLSSHIPSKVQFPGQLAHESLQ